ncbi:MAG: hypothetical protein ABF437_13200 [Lentilactobacillus hilgardii]
MELTSAKKTHSWTQLSDGYLSKTPIFQFLLVSMIFPLWGAAASCQGQFKNVGFRQKEM